MALTTDALRRATKAIAARIEAEHETLNALDGQVGDGDLGITLLKAFRELDRMAPELPDDLGTALMQGAGAVAKVSSSSFGTLLATAMIAAGKTAKGRTEVPWSEVPGQLEAALAAMMARGKAALGDKTVLDALDAAAKGAAESAAAAPEDPAAMLASARAGIDAALAEYRDKPNKIGRARIFAERTVGMDDPGMVALRVMAEAL